MTSRRPMTRSYSGNGRTSSFSEEESSSSNGRTESRNTYLSNVRPENSYSRYSHYRPTRSTLCSVMAQLTEDIQPSFETTLKSKAVSENCNVKFTCVVSGYPAPELKWYKDDMEMDRYCGLPKYEIRRNGKTHTLHIYNCTLDDAAIYQVSASNSKGIVSCSGVLEVGTMNEYKIHQRFFAKLKLKAEKKKKDMEEHTKKEGKENIRKDEVQSGQEHPQRKRSVAPPEDRPVVKKPVTVEQPGETAEPKRIRSASKEDDPSTATSGSSETEVTSSQDTLAKKRIKMSNGVGAGAASSNSSSSNGSKSHLMGNAGENCYDGGISLAQFLAETLQSQAPEEKQESSQEENPKEMDATVTGENKLKDQDDIQKMLQEQENSLNEACEQRKEVEATTQREKERERQLEILHTTNIHSKQSSEVKHHIKGHKDHDHINIQASITSMLHTVKDFLFGKNKKDSRDFTENEDKDFDPLFTKLQPHNVDTPPSSQLFAKHYAETEEAVPMEIDQTEDSTETIDKDQQSIPPEPLQGSFLHASDNESPPQGTEESTMQNVVKADEATEVMKTEEPEGSDAGKDKSLPGPRVPTEVEEKNSDIVSTIQEVPTKQQESASQLSINPSAKDGVSPEEDECVLPQAHAFANEVCPFTPSSNESESGLTPPSSLISATDNHGFGETFSKEIIVEKASKGGVLDTGEGHSSNKSCEEEKPEVKFNEHLCSDINRSENTKLSASSVEDRLDLSESKTPDMVDSPFSVVVPCSTQTDRANETKCTSHSQEMNVGFPPTSVPKGLENSDLKMQNECKLSEVGEITEAHSDKQRSDLAFCHSEGDWLKEQLNPTFGTDLERNLCNILKTQEQATIEVESNTRDEVLQCTQINLEELNKSKTLLSENSGNDANGTEKADNISYQNSGCPLKNIPSIQISTTEDIPDVKTSVLNFTSNEPFKIPTIEILEPELPVFKECTLPLTILALNKPESTILPKHDATCETKIIIKDDSMADSPALFPSQKGVQNNDDISPTEKGKEVAQEKLKQQPPHVQRTQQLPQMENASIPIINVSRTDDKQCDTFNSSDESCPQQTSGTPMVPTFVVPPISVTCHESDPELKLPTHIKWTETDISAGTQSETNKGVDKNTTTKPEIIERSEDFEEISDKSIKENPPTVLYDALKPKAVDSVLSPSKPTEDTTLPETFKPKPLKDAKIENSMSIEDFLKSRPSVERLCSKPPTYPSLSPASLRKFMSKAAPDSDNDTTTTAPVISAGDRQSDKADEDLSGGSTPTSSLSCESSPRVKRRDSLTLIRSATPEELASGARRKIFIPKSKEDIDGAMIGVLEGKKETPYMSPSQARRAALLQASTGQNTPPMERRSPLLSRRKATLEVPKVMEETPSGEPASTKKEDKSNEKKADPLKAPQVIRKIRGEPFPDASGHLKLWCQFFNVLSDSTIKWYKDEEEILEVKRSGGDESQVALAIVLASNQDCGVYGCTISNEYGSDTTDYLLSTDILAEMLLKDDLEVGEEIEMTPLLFAKGLADYGSWGEKYFGRIFTETLHMGDGCAHKASRVKVIYGLDPIFESGSTCIIKVQNPIAYGTKQESNLAERNLDITKQECKVQNTIREYCKIFAAEARVIGNFGFSLEVIPRYLMYRPAKSVPYATVEADLTSVFVKYCTMDPKGKLSARNVSEVEQKCCTFQHWIHQWTHGNLLVTQLEGVETKITNVKVVTKSKGYQGLTQSGSPEVFDQFLTLHQCNYYCGLLGLRPLKITESLQQPAKIKGSRSPLLNRKLGSNSPQVQRKGQSPQMSKKANSSPKMVRKVQETEDSKSGSKPKASESLSGVEIR